MKVVKMLIAIWYLEVLLPHLPLSDILKTIKSMDKDSGASHIIVVGPRGMGKTHLMCFLYRYVKGDIETEEEFPKSFDDWLPILFVEEEGSAFNSLANFLLKLFEKLQDAQPNEKDWILPQNLEKETDRAVIDCCLERKSNDS